MSFLINLLFPSRVLLKPVDVVIGLPEKQDGRLPVLWALHCAMENGDYFFRYLDAGRLSQHLSVAVIAPSLGNGFFMNTSYEPQADFLEELAETLPNILAISKERSGNAVIGISMGGFGAVRWALESGHFFAAAAISGVFDASLPLDRRALDDPAQSAIHNEFSNLMRSRLTDPAGCLPQGGNLKKHALPPKSGWPRMLFFCGEQDYLSLEQTTTFYDFCRENGADAILQTNPGSHNLHFWRWAFPLAAAEIFRKEGQADSPFSLQ